MEAEPTPVPKAAPAPTPAPAPAKAAVAEDHVAAIVGAAKALSGGDAAPAKALLNKYSGVATEVSKVR